MRSDQVPPETRTYRVRFERCKATLCSTPDVAHTLAQHFGAPLWVQIERYDEATAQRVDAGNRVDLRRVTVTGPDWEPIIDAARARTREAKRAGVVEVTPS